MKKTFQPLNFLVLLALFLTVIILISTVYAVIYSITPMNIGVDKSKFFFFAGGLFMLWVCILMFYNFLAQKFVITEENLEIYIFKYVEEGVVYDKLFKLPPLNKHIIPLAEIQMYGLFSMADIAKVNEELEEKLKDTEMIFPAGRVPVPIPMPEFLKKHIDMVLIQDKSGQYLFARTDHTKKQIRRIFKAIEERTGIIPTKI